jgi:hypothetical protein
MLAPDGGGGGAPATGAAAGINAGMESLSQQMADFAQSAKAGQFSVNDAGGKALLGAIQEMQGWLSSQFMDADSFSRTGEYGQSHGAVVVEPYMNNVATDADGLIPMLEKFQGILNDAQKAIGKAMENYQQTESDNASGVRDAGGGDVSLTPSAPRAMPIPYTPPADSGGPRIQSV